MKRFTIFFFFKLSTFQFVLLFLVMFLSGDETNQQFGIGGMFSFLRHFMIGGTGCQPSPRREICHKHHKQRLCKSSTLG